MIPIEADSQRCTTGNPIKVGMRFEIEVSRARYMDEASLLPHSGFAQVQEFCRDLVSVLGSMQLR